MHHRAGKTASINGIHTSRNLLFNAVRVCVHSVSRGLLKVIAGMRVVARKFLGKFIASQGATPCETEAVHLA